MIDSDDLEKLRELADGVPLLPPPPQILRELARVYLAVIDAPEGVTVRNEYGCTEIQGVFAEEGKRVRLVVVEDE